MQGLRDVLEQTQKNGVAIGHFNVADSVLLKAVFTAAQELKRLPTCRRVVENCLGISASNVISTMLPTAMPID